MSSSNMEKNIEQILKKDIFLTNEFKKKKCFFYILNCCKKQYIKSKDYYIEKWRKFLTEEAKSKEKINDPFTILTKIWAYKSVIYELEKVRINPNLIRSKNSNIINDIIIRNDLEFYIPQLCSFILFGDNILIDELLSFLCKACYSSFFFAHRVIWFLKSILMSNQNNNKINLKINNIIHVLQTIYKTNNNDKGKIMNFCIAGNNQYIECINNFNKEEKKNNNALNSINKTINNISNYKFNNNMNNKILDIDNLKNISSILKLNIFSYNDFYTNNNNNNNNNIYSNIIKQIDNNDLNLTSFLSTIYFFDYLSNICEKIKLINKKEDRKNELYKELNKINEKMPYNIYIPFNNNQIRNYMISKFNLKYSKIMKSKERAPILLTIECFRLEELCYEKNNIKSYEFSMKEIKDSLSGILLNNNNDIKIDIKKTNRKSSIDEINEIKINKDNYLIGIDIDLNKPIFIGKNIEKNEQNFEDNNNNFGYKKLYKDNNNNIELIKDDLNLINNEIEKEEKFDEIDNYINENTKNNNNIKYNKINEDSEINLYDSKNNNNNNIFNKLNNNNNKEEEEKNNINYTLKINDSINKSFHSDYGEELSESSSSSDNESNFSDSINEKLKNNKKIKNKIFNINNSSINRYKSNIYLNIFGPSLSEQEEILKKQSIYGFLSSYKIFKFIVKNGEDLRQEQFASQLINEFAQIFKIENVDIFLYPYEIISTGYNTGIIEVVPNSISIDELKHKMLNINNITDNSLKNFYRNYFEYNSNKYKKAIKNLIRSLAGYSLICYFLQIKDRHNGNILINNEGYLIQIDFGFFLSNAPGNEFEKAPFKLTDEIIEVLGGVNSKNFEKFRKLMWKGMLAISRHYEKIMILVEMMYCGYGTKMECFKAGDETLQKLRKRFKPKEKMRKRDYLELVDDLIHQAISNWRTKWYDKYQYFFEGIFY